VPVRRLFAAGVFWVLSESLLFAAAAEAGTRGDITPVTSEEFKSPKVFGREKVEAVEPGARRPSRAEDWVKKGPASRLPVFRPNFLQILTRFRTGQRV
jgi:hypothetical protein